MQLQPREYFTIVRQLADHSDPATNYVQAKVRNARTDELLATVNLTHQGTQRFTSEYQIPADVSGLGFYISIVTLVYTDSGYSNLNSNYSAEEHTYLVQDRMMRLQGRGGPDIDYKRIQKMIAEAIAAQDKPVPVDLAGFKASLLKDIDSVCGAYSGANKKDIESLRAEFAKMIAAHKPEQKDIDLSPVLSQVKAIGTVLVSLREAIEALPSMQDGHQKALRSVVEELFGSLVQQVTELMDQGKVDISSQIKTATLAAASPEKLKDVLMGMMTDETARSTEKKPTSKERAARLLE